MHMKITAVHRFDDVIADEHGNVQSEYHGYNLMIGDISCKIYDHEMVVYVQVAAHNDAENHKYDEIQRSLWRMATRRSSTLVVVGTIAWNPSEKMRHFQ